jgi:hypothetical protein
MKFIYGPPVKNENFVNRVNEINKLISIIHKHDYVSPMHVVISAPRRIGKTSLVLEAGRRLEEEGYIFINLDLLSITSIGGFVDELRNRLLESLPYTESAFIKISSELKKIRVHLPKISYSDKGLAIEDVNELLKLYRPTWRENLSDIFKFLRKERRRKFVISLDEMGFIRNVEDTAEATGFLSFFEKELTTHNTPPFILNGSQNFLHLVCEVSNEIPALWKRKLLKLSLPNFTEDVTRYLFITAMNTELGEHRHKISRNLLTAIADIVYFISSGYPSVIQIIGYELAYELNIQLSKNVEITCELIEDILFDNIFIKVILRDSNNISRSLLSSDTLGSDYINLKNLISDLYQNRTGSMYDIDSQDRDELLRLVLIIEELQYITLDKDRYSINYNFLKYYTGHPAHDDISYREVKDKWNTLVSKK